MMEDCDICFLKYQYTSMTGLQCGHRFCKSCWIEYLTTKIMEEGLCKSIACAAHGCDILVDDVTVMNLLTEPRVRTKYQQLITNSFVECNRLLRWCPSADCSYAVKVQYVDARPVECKCGHVFCFECGEQWHDPVQCRLLRKWIKKCDDDSETSNWIAANTKECPKCNVTIEKDGGCNHMVSASFLQLVQLETFPHSSSGLQKPTLQARLLLGVPRILGASWKLMVQLQPLRWRRSSCGTWCAGKVKIIFS